MKRSREFSVISSFKRLLAVLGVGLILISCESAPSVGDGPYAKILGRAIPKVEKYTGLTFKQEPVLETRSRDEVREFLLNQLSKERAVVSLNGQERVYKRLGMVPDSMDISLTLRRLLEEQIVGYYDPATKVLYVVEDVKPDILEITITHELVHALQDQYVNIDSIQNATQNADRQMAAQSILEGQAVYVQLVASLGETAMRMGGWDRAKLAMRDAQDGMPVFSSAPMIIRESLLFPYTGGADFVYRFVNRRSGDNVLNDMPISTTQLLSDAAYFGSGDSLLAFADRPVPVVLELPDPTRGKVIYKNVFGEFESRLVLFHFLKNEVQAARAVQGIRGDSYSLIEIPEGEAFVWASMWSSTVEAAEFVNAINSWLRQRYPGIATRDEAEESVRRWGVRADSSRGVSSARSVRVEVTEHGGHSMVVITDAPLGRADGLIEVSAIKTEN